MERQNRLLMVLSVVLLAMVAVAVALKPKEGEDTGPRDHREPPSHDLFDYKNEDITRVELHGPKGDEVFEKTDGKWQMTAPKAVPIDDRKVSDIVERLNTLKIEDRTLDGKLEDYGLGDGARTEVKLAKADGTAYTVYVGSDAPVGYRTYIAESAQGPAKTGSSRITDLFPGGPDDFRSKDLWSVASATTKRIQLSVDGASTILRKDDHGWWLGDTGPRADDDAVADWLQKITIAKADKFLDGADEAALGLGTPTARVVLEDGDGTHELLVGLRGADGAAVKTPTALVHVGADVVGLLSLGDVLGKKLMPVRTWQVDTVDLQLGAKTAKYTKDNDDWKDAAGASSGLPTTLMKSLGNLQVDRTRTDLPATIGAAWGHIVLAEGSTRKESVQLGDAQGDSRLAKDDAGGPTFLVKQTDLDGLAASLP